MKNPYIGNVAQIGGTRHYILSDGWGRGVRAADIDTGAGLRYTILADRGMDISLASFKGRGLCYLTFNGETSPVFYEQQGGGWLRTFTGGLLTTCGLNNISGACTDNGEELGLHGRYSTTPATKFSDLSGWEDGRYVCRLRGVMESGCLFGHKMTLVREITSVCGENTIRISDTVTNSGDAPAPLNILYHINLGYPLLDENAQLIIEPESTEPADKYSAANLTEMKRFVVPRPQFREQLFFHRIKNGFATLRNPAAGMELTVRFDAASLPYLSQWKMMGCGEYVLGLEPGNVPSRPRDYLRSAGLLPYLEPGEEYKTGVEIIVNGL